MRTTDLFKFNRAADRLNESIEKLFGTKLNLESFDLEKLQDARNKLRTQLSQVRSESGFNENLENEAFSKAQFMLDAINAEIIERQEFIADPHVAEVVEGNETLDNIINSNHEAVQHFLETGEIEHGLEMDLHSYYYDRLSGQAQRDSDDQGEIADLFAEDLADLGYTGSEGEGGETDDAYALASAGYGSDEDYGSYDESADPNEYDQEGEMAKDDLSTAEDAAEELKSILDSDENLPEWVQAKITKAVDYLDTSRDYMKAQDANESAPPGAKAERMVKHIKAGYAKDGKLTDKEKSIAYATAWKQHNKKNESVNTGDNMTKLREGEIQQASAIVTAKTMVDRVGRWIEELSGMENDTLLQLGDSIRDEMGQEQAKQFISACAPAIQAALQNLKDTREALASSVRGLTGEEQSANMLGSEEPGMDMAAPDAMNGGEEEAGITGDEFGEEPTDDFAAAEPAAGGAEAAGRMKRESIERGNNLLRVLAG